MKMAAELRTLRPQERRDMQSLLTPQRERKSFGTGFESVGSILKRLHDEKAYLEVHMPRWFDLRHSLKLDQVIITIESLQGSGGVAW